MHPQTVETVTDILFYILILGLVYQLYSKGIW